MYYIKYIYWCILIRLWQHHISKKTMQCWPGTARPPWPRCSRSCSRMTSLCTSSAHDMPSGNRSHSSVEDCTSAAGLAQATETHEGGGTSRDYAVFFCARLRGVSFREFRRNLLLTNSHGIILREVLQNQLKQKTFWSGKCLREDVERSRGFISPNLRNWLLTKATINKLGRNYRLHV